MVQTVKLAACFLMLSVFSTGCQPINQEKTLKLEPGTVQPLTVDAPQSDQKVKITVTSPGVPISAYLVLAKDQSAVEEKLAANKKLSPAQVLASQEKTEEAVLEATVPAKNDYAVIVQNMGTKTVEVKVHITGR